MVDPGLTKLIARYSELLILIALIIFGSASNAMVTLKQAREKAEPFGFVDFIIAMFLAAFSGTLFGFAASAFGYVDEKLYVMVSVGAFMGLTGLNRIVDILLDVFKERLKK